MALYAVICEGKSESTLRPVMLTEDAGVVAMASEAMLRLAGMAGLNTLTVPPRDRATTLRIVR